MCGVGISQVYSGVTLTDRLGLSKTALQDFRRMRCYPCRIIPCCRISRVSMVIASTILTPFGEAVMTDIDLDLDRGPFGGTDFLKWVNGVRNKTAVLYHV